MTEISKDQAKNLIDNHQGHFFSVVFIKKDGTERKMVCRRGVTAHLKGGELKFDPTARGYVVVFDVQKEAYRMINLNTLISVNFGGQQFIIDQAK